MKNYSTSNVRRSRRRLDLTKFLSHSLQYPIKVDHSFKVTIMTGCYLCGPPCVRIRLTVEGEELR